MCQHFQCSFLTSIKHTHIALIQSQKTCTYIFIQARNIFKRTSAVRFLVFPGDRCKDSDFTVPFWHTLVKTNQKRSRNEQSISLFLHFNLDTPVPHFATISYAFATRFPEEFFEKIFSWILEQAVEKRMVDATHRKAGRIHCEVRLLSEYLQMQKKNVPCGIHS